VNLPPLPPVGGEITGRNALELLASQHRALGEMSARLAGGEDQRLRDVLVATLSRHLSAEEQYLYPAIRATVPGGAELADRELAEDHDLLLLLRRLDRGEPVAAEVADAVGRHVSADEEELFPVLEQMVSVEDLIRIGNRIDLAEEAAPTRPHPGTPSTPPWNKIVDPAVAVVDKLRDVVTRRSTYPCDL
jgi:hypothetical protein